MANPNVHKYFYRFMLGTSKTVVFTATIPDAGYLIPDILKFPTIEIRKHPVFSLPGRSSERAKTGNQYPGSRHITNGFHSAFCSRSEDPSGIYLL
jgi:hypothetical protein